MSEKISDYQPHLEETNNDESEDSFYDEEEEEEKGSFNPEYQAGDFHSQTKKCKLDDLSELLKNSKKYSQALASLQDSDSLFVDQEFKTNESSLLGYFTNEVAKKRVRNLKWQRPSAFFEHPAVVYNTMSPGDIRQGRLGDCYFLAAISALAEHPHRIQRLFLTKENHGNGLYAVALCLNGVWEEVILDDFVPCKASGKLAFNTSRNEELWVVLLEKAWAKVHGGYLNIEAGLTREALRDLTGASVTTFFTNEDSEGLWDRLVDAENKNFVMTAGSDDLNGGSDNLIVKIGISGSHAYSLLAVFTLTEQNGEFKVGEGNGVENQHRLVKLRNPWGKGEWTGKWSDTDPNWTSELKESLGFTEDVEDGIFFMLWEDFLKYFSDVQICYYHDDFKYNAEKFITKKGETIFLKFTLHKKGLHYFSLNQRNKRFFHKSERYRYSLNGWAMGIKKNGKYEFVESGSRQDKENWQKFECEEGEYVVMINTPWKSKTREFSFSIYGPDFVDFEVLSEINVPDNFVQQIFTSRAKKEIEKEGKILKTSNHLDIKYVSSEHNGWGYFYFENREKDYLINIELIPQDDRHGILRFDSGFQNNFNLKIDPGKSEIIIYQRPRKKPTFKKINSRPEIIRTSQIDIDTIKKQNNVIQKIDDQKDLIDVFLYFYEEEDQLTLLYENNTTNIVYQETVEFSLINAKINKNNGNQVNILLHPGKHKIIKIKRNLFDEPFEIRIDKFKSFIEYQ